MEETRELTLEESRMLERAWKYGAKRLIIGWINPAPDASPARAPSESVTIALSPSTRGE